MDDIWLVVAVLVGQSLLNIATWTYLIARTNREVRETLEKVQETIKMVKG